MKASGWRGAAWARVAAVVLTLLSLSLGGQAQAAETTTYVLTDVQGTVLAREDAQGNIIARYDYRPYGKQQAGPVAAGPGYTGHVGDPDTGLVYMQQRYYDPEVGRFLGLDPIATAGRAGYAYANNNPLKYTDPDGMWAEDCGIECKREITEERDRKSQEPYTGYVPYKTVRSTSTSSDEFARLTAPFIHSAGRGNNNEYCAGMCPAYDEDGKQTGFYAEVVSSGSPAWCRPRACNGGGASMIINHSHGRRSFIANEHDHYGNRFAVIGTLQHPDQKHFSAQDKSVGSIVYLTYGETIYKFDPSTGEVSKLK